MNWINLRMPEEGWREYYSAEQFDDFPLEPWDGIYDAIFDDDE